MSIPTIGRCIMEISTTSSYGNSVISAYINQYDKEIKTSLEKLSSGLRVRTPSDDPGTYFQSQSLQRHSQRASFVSKSIDTHLSRVRSAEDYLTTVNTMLGDMSVIAKQAAEETNNTLRLSLGEEYDEKLSALEEYIQNAKYAGQNFIDGTYDDSVSGLGSGIIAQVDEGVNDTYAYELLDTRTSTTTGLNLSAFADAANDWVLQSKATEYVSGLEDQDSGITRIQRNLNRISTHKTILEGAQNNLANKASNYQAASSALVSVDDAAESTKLSVLQVRQQAAASFLAQSNSVSNNIIGMLTGFTRR